MSDAIEETAVGEPPATAPTRYSAVAATVAATLVPVALVTAVPLAATVAFVGIGFVAAGVALARRRLVTAGFLLQLLAIGLAGWVGGAIPAVLAATVFCVVAWDLGGYAIELGAQLGRDAETLVLEVVHSLASLGVGVAVAGLGGVVYALVGGVVPAGGVLALVVGAALLASSLRG